MEAGKVPIIIFTTPLRKELLRKVANKLDISMRKVVERAIDFYIANFSIKEVNKNGK